MFNNLAEVIGSVGAKPADIEAAFETALADQSFGDLLLPFLKSSGIATLVNGQTSIVVTHGVSPQPTADQIQVTPIEAWGAATEFWFDTITATQFTIRVDLDPTQDVDFAWRVDRI